MSVHIRLVWYQLQGHVDDLQKGSIIVSHTTKSYNKQQN